MICSHLRCKPASNLYLSKLRINKRWTHFFFSYNLYDNRYTPQYISGFGIKYAFPSTANFNIYKYGFCSAPLIKFVHANLANKTTSSSEEQHVRTSKGENKRTILLFACCLLRAGGCELSLKVGVGCWGKEAIYEMKP